MSERTRLHYPTVYVVHTEDKNRYKSVPDYTVYVGGDEGRRGARPRRERSDQGGGHGHARDRERHTPGTLVPRVPGRRSGEALGPRPKGRPRGSKSKPKPEPTREQELAEQVAYLKAKVAYLEKLRALRASKSRGASEAPSERRGVDRQGLQADT